MAWCRFTYTAIRQVVLAIVKTVLAGGSLTKDDAWKITWNTLYDLQADYQNIIVDREQRACTGLRLMFGLTNPWANVIYYQCMAQTQLVDNLFSLGLNLFVDIPMATCVCKDAKNQPIALYATQTCAPKLPATLVPTLYMIVNQLTGNVPYKQKGLACDAVMAYVRGQVTSAMDPLFSSAFSALDALADSVDYFLIAFDPGAGQCLHVGTDPHVVVIVPQPADYFLKCAGTSICQVRLVYYHGAALGLFNPLDFPAILG